MLPATTPRAQKPRTRQLARSDYVHDPEKGLEHLLRLEEAPLDVSATRPARAMRGDSALVPIRAARISSGVDYGETRDLWAIWLLP
jgi:hypothetical protein